MLCANNVALPQSCVRLPARCRSSSTPAQHVRTQPRPASLARQRRAVTTCRGVRGTHVALAASSAPSRSGVLGGAHGRHKVTPLTQQLCRRQNASCGGTSAARSILARLTRAVARSGFVEGVKARMASDPSFIFKLGTEVCMDEAITLSANLAARGYQFWLWNLDTALQGAR